MEKSFILVKRIPVAFIVLCAASVSFLLGVLLTSYQNSQLSFTESQNMALNKIMIDQKLASETSLKELNNKNNELLERYTQVLAEKKELESKLKKAKKYQSDPLQKSKQLCTFSYTPNPKKRSKDFRCRMDEWVIGEWKSRKYVPKALLYPPEGSSKINTGAVEEIAGLLYKQYSPEEAQSCLKGKKIVVIGDSYMRNLFIGLSDVIVGNLSNAYDRQWRPHRFNPEDYGNTQIDMISPPWMSFWQHSMEHIYFNLTQLRAADLIVVGILVHDIKKDVLDRPEVQKFTETDWINMYLSYLHR